MSRADMLGDYKHTQVTAWPCSLRGRVWIDVRRVKGLYRPSVRIRSTNAAILLRESITLVEEGSGESGGSCASASERSTIWTGKGGRRDGLSRQEQGDDGSGRESYREPDMGTVSAGVFQSSDSDSPRERRAIVGLI